MKKILFALFFLSTGIYSNAQQVKWYPTNGPFGGIVNAFTVCGNHVFAGTPNAGIFISADTGGNWQGADNGLTTIYVNAFATMGNNIFAGTEFGGVFLSTNNGASWKAMTTGMGGKSILCFTVSGSKIFAGSDNGVYLSVDTAKTWVRLTTGLTSTLIHSMCTIGNHVFAGTSNGVYISNNNGSNWALSNSGISNNSSISSMAYDGTRLYAATYGHGVFISTDTGATWTLSANGLTTTYINTLITNSDSTYAGTNTGIFVTTDNGANWHPLNNGLTTLRVISLRLNNGLFYAGTDGGGIFLSKNNGNNWTADNAGFMASLVQTFTVKTTYLFAGTSKQGIFLSADQGNHWTEVNNGLTSKTVWALTPQGENIFAGTDSGAFLSTDNGNHWIAINNGLNGLPVKCILVKGNYVFAGTGNNGIFISNDSGKHWTNTTNNLITGVGVTALGLKGDTLLVCMAGNGVFESTSNGTLWSSASGGMVVSSDVISFVSNGDTLFAALNGNGLYLSTRIGVWKASNNGISSTTLRCLALCSGNIFAGSPGSGIFYSKDNGAHKTYINNGLLKSSTAIAFGVIGNVIFAGTPGNGVYKTSLLPDISFSGQSPICNGGADGSICTSTFGGIPPYKYHWSTGNSGSCVSNLVAGNYTLTVTDSTGTITTGTYTLTDHPALNIDALIDSVSCHGGSNGRIELTITGGVTPYNYLWAGGETTQNISGLNAGSFTVSVTDAAGCLAMQNIVINESPVKISIKPPSTTIKSGDSAPLVASGATSYVWAPAEGLNKTTGDSVIASPLITTTYTVTGSTNGCNETKQVVITVTDFNGINNTSLSSVNGLLITPNPGTGNFIVQTNNLFKTIEVFNLLGQPVYSNTTATENNTFNLPLNDLSNGIYVVKVLTGTGNLVSRLVIGK